MSTDYLIKDFDAAVPATDGSPGTPPTPAFCLDISTTVPEYRTLCILRAGVPHTVGDPPQGTCLLSVSIPTGNQVAGPSVHTCFDAEPGTPPIAGTTGSPADYHAGWTGFARSVDSQAGDFSYIFHVLDGGGAIESTIGVVTGLAQGTTTANYADIEYGLMFQEGTAQVIERGVLKGDPQDATSPNYWNIQRNGNVIEYYNFNDDTPFYVSTVASTSTMYAHAWLYYGGDKVMDAQFVDFFYSTPITYGGSDGVLTSLAGFAGDGACSVNGELNGLVEDIDNTFGVLTPLIGTAGQPITPQFCISYGVLDALSGFSFATPRTEASVTGVLSAIHDYSSQSGKAECHGVLTDTGLVPLILINFNYCQGILDGLSGNRGGHSGTVFGRHIHPGTLFAYGESPQILNPAGGVNPGWGMYGAHSGDWHFKAAGGAQARGVFPRPHVTIGVTVTTLGGVATFLPSGTFSGHGIVTTLGEMLGATLGDYPFVAAGGAQEAGRLPRGTFSGHIMGGSSAESSGLLPRGTFLATAETGTWASAVGVLPALRISPSGYVVATLPSIVGFSTGGVAITVEYEAYSITFVPGQQGDEMAVGRYTQYPFERIVRFGSKYYGVATDGLFELEGETFDDDPIISVFETMDTDFGTSMQKRPAGMYVHGRMGTKFGVSVVSSENQTNAYSYVPRANGSVNNQRVIFGKGIKAATMAFAFTNTDGEDFELSNFMPDVAVLKRAI